MRFDPTMAIGELEDVLRNEVAAAFGRQRAQEDEAQIQAAATALRWVAEIEVQESEEDPFFLGVPGND